MRIGKAPDGDALAGLFARVLGRELRYRAAEPEELGAAIDRAAVPGAGDDIAALYRLERATAGARLRACDMLPVLAQLPVTMTSLEAWIDRNREAFASGSGPVATT